MHVLTTCFICSLVYKQCSTLKNIIDHVSWTKASEGSSTIAFCLVSMSKFIGDGIPEQLDVKIWFSTGKESRDCDLKVVI